METTNILLFIVVGFIAQIIDGSLGMAYGVSSNALLLTLGIPPAAASASVHTSEVFTTLVSGISHFKLGNVDMNLVKKLAVPGVLGGVLGAYVISNINNTLLKPIVSIYLLIMGINILVRAFQNTRERDTDSFKTLPMILLGLVGGFLDAAGGGGWGPIVTTTLISQGSTPRKSIGSVNLTEFFVTFAEALAFIFTIGFVHWQIIVGLLTGGVIAAPLGAYFTKRIPIKPMLILVGSLIILLNLRTLLQTWGVL
ncbi:MAG: sulfite exporter TauE/SafE family protein [Anaerolineaceae bacterium]|jgi:uncharacterized membrane protein YfcA|nr:sulfite exporter TauE/SafE family protein [Anaerolineaceae bacterium]